MSQHTVTYLHENQLIGFTEKRGNAWWYRLSEDAKLNESSHYPGAIPVGDVTRRLFATPAVSRPITVSIPADFDTMDSLDESGMPVRLVTVDNKQAIVFRGQVVGIFSDGYQIHQYDEWLLKNVSSILGDSLAIGSAGLLKFGAVAYVSVEVPDSITTPEGVEFRPNLLATTSLDGSLATTYKRVVTNVVCDNTHAAAMSERGQVFRVKHTRNSAVRITEARDALAMVHNISDAFAEQVKTLCETSVTRDQFSKFRDLWSPIPEEKGKARTIAENKQDAITRLYLRDFRVAPWQGTAWGVVQAVNTFVHHEQTVRGAGRAERNMLRACEGSTTDADTLATLERVLVNS